MQINGLKLVTSKSTQGQREPDARVRARQEHRRGRDRRPDRDLAGDGQPPGRPAVAADVLQDQSERPADHVHRADERLGDAGRSSTTTRAPRSGSASASCPASAASTCSATKSAIRIKADLSALWARGHLDRRPRRGDPRGHELRSAPGSSTGRRARSSLRPQRPARDAPTQYAELDRRDRTNGTPRPPARRRRGDRLRRRTSASTCASGSAATRRPRPPSSSRSTARRARTPSRSRRSVRDLLPRHQRRAARLDPRSRRSTTARRRSSTRSSDVQMTLLHRVRPRRAA